jgi:hypothetical protein
MNMTMGEVIQLAGCIVSFGVLAKEILDKLIQWRSGSPELRVISKALDRIQTEQVTVLRQIHDKMRG